MKIFVCSKCYNAAGTLQNIGSHKNPNYVHAGKCPPKNYMAMYEIYSRMRPDLFWLPLLNIGVDYEKFYIKEN